jgi:hypothetical protein
MLIPARSHVLYAERGQRTGGPGPSRPATASEQAGEKMDAQATQ